MNIQKVKDIIKTINLITETMSLYANVEIGDINTIVLDNQGSVGEISYLSRNSKHRLSNKLQILVYCHEYNSNISRIEAKIKYLNENRTIDDFISTGNRKRNIEILCESLNHCQKLKSKTIEIHTDCKLKGVHI